MGFDPKSYPPKLQEKILVAELAGLAQAREMGKLGGLFGSRETLTTVVLSIAALVLVLCIAGIIFSAGEWASGKRDAVQLIGGLLSGLVGYLIGSTKHRQRSD